MYSKNIKILTMAILLSFSCFCTKSIYIAPNEGNKISDTNKIIIKMNDLTEVELSNVNIDTEKEIIVGYTEDMEKKEIDFSLIQSVKIIQPNAQSCLNLGTTAVAIWLIYGVLFGSDEPEPDYDYTPESTGTSSCPFIYSFDGEQYIFDAEPYGAAICQGLKRTDWCGLEYLKDSNGTYRIMVTNELDETQYVDELKLMVIDHPRGVKIASDVNGGIHTYPQPLTPIRGYDENKTNLLPYISQKEGVCWKTDSEKEIPQKKENLRNQLTFEFPKPKDAKKAKLLVHAATTLWGSQIAKRFLELRGNKLSEWYNEVNNLGPAFHQVMSWFYNEELYLLQVRVATENGWKPKGTIFGSGPFIAEDKAYILDISDVPGDTLKIKLLPPAHFWMIDYLAVDYSDDLPVQVTEVKAKRAVDSKGQDLNEIVAENDNNYYLMPDIGDQAELFFEAPPKHENLERSLILKASGYYDIHLRTKGEPQTAILERIHSDPGFSVKYACDEYRKWKEKNNASQ